MVDAGGQDEYRGVCAGVVLPTARTAHVSGQGREGPVALVVRMNRSRSWPFAVAGAAVISVRIASLCPQTDTRS